MTAIMRCPNCDGPLDAEGFHASEWAACDWLEPVPESERVPDHDGRTEAS